jgi:hypothetical protein
MKGTYYLLSISVFLQKTLATGARLAEGQFLQEEPTFNVEKSARF